MTARYDTIPNCPIWIKNRKYRPSEYIRLFEELKELNGTVRSDKVSALLFKSGLHPQQLAHIWFLLNNNGGILSEQEFVIVLALIGLVQRGAQVKDLNTLFRVGMPPVPDLSKGSSIPGNTSTTNLDHNDDDDDEFSDFQAAVPVQTSSIPTNTKPPSYFGSPFQPKPTANINSTTPRFGTSTFPKPNFNNNIPPSIVPNKGIIPTQKNLISMPGAGTGIKVQNQKSPVLPQRISIPNPTTHPVQTNKQTKTQSSNESLLIGDADKYSALRDLMDLDGVFKSESKTNETTKTNEISHTIPTKIHESSLIGNLPDTNSPDFDFGDFQSFSTPTTSQFKTGLPAPIAQVPLIADVQKSEIEAPKLPGSLPQPKNIVEDDDWGDADYGDFVSCKSDTVEEFTQAPVELKKSFPKPVQTQMSEPELLLDVFSNISSSSRSLVIKVDNSLSHSTNTDNTNILSLLELDPFGSVPTSNCSNDGAKTARSSSVQNSDLQSLNFSTIPPLKTTLIGTSEPTDITLDNENSYNSNSEEDPDSFGDFALTIPTPNSAPQKSNGVFVKSVHQLDPDPEEHTKMQRLNKQNSPETMSIASLDLGSYSGYDNLSIDALRTPSGNSPLPGIGINNLEPQFKTKETEPSTPGATPVDKYSSFREELENEEFKSLAFQEKETEKLISHWKRMLEVCIKLIQRSQSVFSSTSSEVLEEILSSNKGYDYLLDLCEVNMVACRIYYTWMKTGGTEILGELHQKLAVAWDSLVPFLNGSNLETEFNRKFKPEEMLTRDKDATNICCVCLLGTIRNSLSVEEEDEPLSMLLDFHGKFYHLPCANLWLNEIDSTLPF